MENLLITVNLLVQNMLVLFHSVYPMKTVYFMKQYHQKNMVKYVWKKVHQYEILVSFTESTPSINTFIHTVKYIFSKSSNISKGFIKKLWSSFCVSYRIMRDVGIKWRALKFKQDFLLWLFAKPCKIFWKLNDNVKYDLQKWTISHPHVIQSPMTNIKWFFTTEMEDWIMNYPREWFYKYLSMNFI